MPTIREFFSTEDEKEIVKAIAQAEANTSGEIRVHIETNSSDEPMVRAKQVFQDLGMQNTKERNGVLFYLCINSKSFVILGDEGIDQKVQSENFWEGTKELVINHFKQGLYKQGLIQGILKAGIKLKAFFPHLNTDKNELTNEISKA
ncbi:TPM domain-containing protein [Myroides pelagicus]|uniref:TPM domain-containing protein n=1 Tax=Myroides pelagicus TaxID=270914 RepID=A0A7K1GPH6_9FLAO|nr:TPM domain-containing protein [Myroides pelagicus]MEC4115024.1 TPM domain-containing protein [Myroides pelagicus]MTH30746.1 TPM domain-containing protein [Myroides pelagicus]